MNCKPGDLAVIVGGWIAEFHGRIVTVVSPCPVWPEGWDVDPPLFAPGDTRSCSIADCTLRPIRDNDGEDETLTWAGKPNDIKEPA